MTQEELFKKLVAHCKEYGFIFPSSEIYDGLSAVYDYGQMGVELKNNIKRYWWDSMTKLHDNIVGIDAAIFMHPRVWEASGHVGAFNDPLIDNKDSKKRYRADVLIEELDCQTGRKDRQGGRKGPQTLRGTVRRGAVPRHQSARGGDYRETKRNQHPHGTGAQRQRPRRPAPNHHRHRDSLPHFGERATGRRYASST